jgi:Domain of unknown function (DUF4082)
MTSYRLFPATSGPSSATSFSNTYIAGLLFEVVEQVCWLEGYWWWVCPTGGLTSPQKCALWSVQRGPTATGIVVPGSVTTSGALSSGWNFIQLATPVQIAPGSTYIAATGVNGNFPDTSNSWGSGNVYAAGITAGPLNAFSDTSGSNADPYGNPQGIFLAFAGSDPSTSMPTSGNSSFNAWLDVQVSDSPPAGFSGTYRLWPNKFDADLWAQAGTDAAQDFTLATEIHTSAPVTTSWVWFYSPTPAASLPSWCGIWRISDQSIVAQNTSPSWLTPDGSGAATAAGGWCKATLSSALPADDYKVAVFNSNGTGGGWSAYNYGYWLTGPGSAGITSGSALSAPSQPNASNALIFDGGGASEPSQGTFSAADALHYPDTAVDFNVSGPSGAIAESFWVDLEVSSPSFDATTSLSVTLGLTATASAGHSAAAALTPSPAITATATVVHQATASLSVTPSLTATAMITIPANSVVYRIVTARVNWQVAGALVQ